MPDCALPSPGTACFALRWSGHAVHALISRASAWRASSFIGPNYGTRSWLRRRFPREIHHIGIRAAGHLDDVDDEPGALEHRERLFARREIEPLAASTG